MNIYVGNLPRSTSQEAVKSLFEQYGEVSEVKLIKDRETDQLKGFGFVTMTSHGEAERAIKEINGTELDGRALTVNEARQRENNSRGGNRGGFKPRSW